MKIFRWAPVVLLCVVPFLQGSGGGCGNLIPDNFTLHLPDLQSAVDSISHDSTAWRSTLKDLESKMATDASSLASQVHDMAIQTIAFTTRDIQCHEDVMGIRVVHLLTNMIHSIKKEPLDPIPPTVCHVQPDHFDLGNMPAGLNVWGVDLNDQDKPVVVVVDVSNNEAPVPGNLLSRGDNGEMFLNLHDMQTLNPPLLNQSSRQIIFRWHGAKVNQSEIGVQSAAVAPPCGDVGQVCCDPGACNSRNNKCASNGKCVPCGGVDQPCCASDPKCSTGSCDTGDICRVYQVTLPQGTTMRLGLQAPNCPTGWAVQQVWDTNGPGYFACFLTANTKVTELPAGLLCGYGHTGVTSATCEGQSADFSSKCPPDYDFVSFRDYDGNGDYWFGCVLRAARSIGPNGQQGPPSGTICGLSHTLHPPYSSCNGRVPIVDDASSCPPGYRYWGNWDRKEHDGQGQFGCMKR